MKTKTYATVALGAVIALGSVPGSASAQQPTISEVRAERNAWVKELKAEGNHLRQQYKETREDAKEVREERKALGTAERKELRAGAKAERAEMKERFKNADTDEDRDALKEEAKAKREELKGEAKEKRELFRAENKDLRNEFKKKATDRLKERLLHIEKRLDAALARFNQLTDRIQTYLDKKAANGTDISAAQAALDASGAQKDIAKAKVKEVKEAVRAILASDTPREELKGLRALIKDAASSIRDANKVMKEAIRLAKGLSKPVAEVTPASVVAEESTEAEGQ